MDDFDTEFNSLWRRAYGVAYVVLGDRGESEDIAQETLARVTCAGRRSRPTPGRGWFEWPEISRSTGAASARTAAPEIGDVPGLDAQRVDLQRALLALSPKQREVVVLRYLVDLPEAEVAKAMGCSVGTVKTHASRGLAALRRSLEVAS